MGLIRYSTGGGYKIVCDWANKLFLHYHDSVYVVSKETTDDLIIGRSVLTEIGIELYRISGATPNSTYLSETLKYLRGNGWRIEEIDLNETAPFLSRAVEIAAAEQDIDNE